LGSLCAAGVLTLLKLNPESPETLAADQPEVRADLKGAVAHGR